LAIIKSPRSATTVAAGAMNKSSARIRSKYSFLLYRGNEKLLVDHVLCIPCETFLKQLSPPVALATALRCDTEY